MLSVVVPTFNEGKNIRNLVTQINDALKGIDYEIHQRLLWRLPKTSHR